MLLRLTNPYTIGYRAEVGLPHLGWIRRRGTFQVRHRHHFLTLILQSVQHVFDAYPGESSSRFETQ
jgi:hypothetical protein